MTRLIDADALSETMKIPLMKVGNRYMIDHWHVTNMIEKAPTVGAEPVRHGHWKHDAKGFSYCSECGSEHIWDYNFCPDCGAKMDGNLLKDDTNE